MSGQRYRQGCRHGDRRRRCRCRRGVRGPAAGRRAAACAARRRRGARARRADLHRPPPRRVRRRVDLLVENGEGPPIVLSHGVTNSIRIVVPRSSRRCPQRASARSRTTTAATVSRCSAPAGHSVENLALDLQVVLEDARPPRRGARRPLDGRRRGAGVRRRSSPRSRPSASAGIVLLSTLATTPLGSHSTRTKRRIEQVTNRAPDMSWMWSTPNLGFLHGAPRLRARPAVRATSSWCARCSPSARPRPGSTRRAR